MATLISLDPGGTTGVAVFYFDEFSVELVRTLQVKGDLKGFLVWAESAQLPEYDVIVCEDFVLRPGVHGANIIPAYIIGALQAKMGHDYPIVLQKPSQKRLCPDDVLKRMGYYKVASPHANDAIRHGIIYLRQMKHKVTLLKGWGE